jgi:hypothetical protein
MVPVRSGVREGAQGSTTPLVGCAQAMMSRPPAGAAPDEMKIAPETAIGSPEGLVDRAGFWPRVESGGYRIAFISPKLIVSRRRIAASNGDSATASHFNLRNSEAKSTTNDWLGRA